MGLVKLDFGKERKFGYQCLLNPHWSACMGKIGDIPWEVTTDGIGILFLLDTVITRLNSRYIFFFNKDLHLIDETIINE